MYAKAGVWIVRQHQIGTLSKESGLSVDAIRFYERAAAREHGVKIEVLYFQGCPHHAPTVERLHDVLANEGIAAEVMEIEVPDARAAESLAFPGSPTVRINGMDIEDPPAAGTIGLSCRVYMHGSIPEGIPPVEAIRRALRKAKETPR